MNSIGEKMLVNAIVAIILGELGIYSSGMFLNLEWGK